MNKKTFTSKEVKKIIGITSQQLEYWIIQALLIPFDSGQGTGSYRRFSLKNLLELETIKKFLGPLKVKKMGRLKWIMEKLEKRAPEYFGENADLDKPITDPKNIVIRFYGDNSDRLILNIRNIEDTLALIERQNAKGRPFFLFSLDAVRNSVIKSI